LFFPSDLSDLAQPCEGFDVPCIAFQMKLTGCDYAFAITGTFARVGCIPLVFRFSSDLSDLSDL